MLKLLIENDLAVYSSHLPLDAHPKLGNNCPSLRRAGLQETPPLLSRRTRAASWLADPDAPVQRDVPSHGKLARVLGRAPVLLPRVAFRDAAASGW